MKCPNEEVELESKRNGNGNGNGNGWEFVTTLIAMMMSLGGEGLSYINQFELPA